MTFEDLDGHEAEVVTPLAGRYRDLDVRVVPPNSQGFVLLEMLAAIERMGIDPDPLGKDAGALASIFRAASADRDRHNADPRGGRLSIATLLDESHIGALVDEARDASAGGEDGRGGEADPRAAHL